MQRHRDRGQLGAMGLSGVHQVPGGGGEPRHLETAAEPLVERGAHAASIARR